MPRKDKSPSSKSEEKNSENLSEYLKNINLHEDDLIRLLDLLYQRDFITVIKYLDKNKIDAESAIVRLDIENMNPAKELYVVMATGAKAISNIMTEGIKAVDTNDEDGVFNEKFMRNKLFVESFQVILEKGDKYIKSLIAAKKEAYELPVEEEETKSGFSLFGDK